MKPATLTSQLFAINYDGWKDLVIAEYRDPQGRLVEYRVHKMGGDTVNDTHKQCIGYSSSKYKRKTQALGFGGLS